ncbi:choice-of-anchor D domain-containing protein [Kaistella flava (ex Peng et al. 2021)]|nr:choice-of-anchor D domain-containing protein [Kaistella flava (ex Peng et al. 2021)]
MKTILPFKRGFFFYVFFACHLFFAQSIFSNPITGTNPNTGNPYTEGQTFNDNISVTGIGRGLGVIGSNANDRYNATGWNSADLDANDYFEFMLTPNSNFSINFLSFVYSSQVSGTGPKNFAIRTSLDSFGTTIAIPLETGGTINLTAANFQNRTASITFRIYAWGASAPGGTFSINDFTFNGSVVSSLIKPEPAQFPAGFIGGTLANNVIALQWIDSVLEPIPDGYLIRWSDTSFAAIPDPADGMPVANSSVSQNVAQGTRGFNGSGFSPATTYYFKIWPYTNSGTAIDYKLGGAPQASATTLAAPCNYAEDFSNSNATNSYTTGSFVGNHLITWSYTEARNEGIYGINGKGILFSKTTSKLASSAIANGISSFSCKLRKGFTGAGNRQVHLFINGAKVATSQAWDHTGVETFTVNNIDIPGVVLIEVRNAVNQQVVIDDLVWTCYTGSAYPDIIIKGNGNNIPDGSDVTAVSNNTDFGSVISGAVVSKTFVIENKGGGDLILDHPAVALLDGSHGFSVSAQPTVNPMTGFTNQSFTVSFSSTTPGTYSEIIFIGSNDPNKTVYVFSVKAVVTQPIILINTLPQNLIFSGFAYDFAQGPSSPTQSFRVDGSDLGSDLTVSVSAGWEISSNAAYDGGNAFPFQEVVFAKSGTNGVTNKVIHIRLKNGLPAGFYSGTISLTSPSAVTRLVGVSGQVLPAKVEMKLTGGTTTINKGSTTPSGLNRTLFAAQNLGNSQTKTYTITNKGGANLILGEISLTGANDIDFSVLNDPAPGTELAQGQSVDFDVRFAPTTVGLKTVTVVIANNDPLRNPYDFAIAGNANFCGAAGEVIIAQQGFESIPQFTELTYTVNNTEMYGPQTGFISGKSSANDKPATNNLYSEGLRGFRIQGGSEPNSSLKPLIFDFEPVDTSIYSNIELYFKVAAFSLGSNTNGMDSFDATGTPATSDADKMDFVLVEISPDNGATWYQQAKLVSDTDNLAWGFGNAGKITGVKNYAANNLLTYFKANAAQQYNEVSIQNLPAVSQLKIRIAVQDNAAHESWILDDIRLISTGLVPKVWNGSAWLPSPPVKTDKVIINGNYNTAAWGGSLQVCQCELNNATVTVSKDSPFIVSDQLLNNGHVIVENEASFVQIHEINTNSGNGTFTVKRNSNLKRLDYTYWASPVSGQNLKTFSPGTIDTRFYTYNEGDDLFEVINPLTNSFGNNHLGVFESAAKGYAIRANNNYPVGTASDPAPMQVFTGIFKGIPNNGEVTFPLEYQSLPAGNGYNMIGNPYASNIDFYQLANNNAMRINKVAYFWTNLNPSPGMQGSTYPGAGYYNNYAILNGTGGIPATLGANANIKSATPTKIIKVGQGFIVKAKQNGTLTFKNTIRTVGSSSVFFNKGALEDNDVPINRYWLHLTTPLQVVTTTLIGYVEDATNGYDADYDTELFGLGVDALFTTLGDRRLGIQGREEVLQLTDVVKVGTSHYATGSYVFSLGEREGIFDNGQPVYLKDKQTGILTNLSEANYRFTANEGLTEGRFEIVYHPETFLTTGTSLKDNLIVYRDGNDFVVKSPAKNISALEVFDASGRLMKKLTPNQKETRLDASNFLNGIYVLKITFASLGAQNGSVVTKKITK